MTASITCPRCGVTSWHPEDVRHGYCGRCHDFTADWAQIPMLVDLVDVDVDQPAPAVTRHEDWMDIR